MLKEINEDVNISLETFTIKCNRCDSKKVTQQLAGINGQTVGMRMVCHECGNMEIVYPTGDSDIINSIQWPEITSGIYESDIKEKLDNDS